MLIDFESIRCFATLAESLNFRRAAQRLALSPAALSDRIRRLEELLGESLFERTTRVVSLTPCGERLLPEVRLLLEGNARFFGLAKSRNVRPRLELLVGLRYELGISWLVPNLPVLDQNAPERTIHLHFGEGPELLDRVNHGLLDGVITSAPIAGSALNHLVLHTEDYCLVGSADLLEHHRVLDAKDAVYHTLLDLTPDLPLFSHFKDHARDGEPWRFKDVEFLGTIGAVRLRILQEAGIAVLPRYFISRDLKEGRLMRIMSHDPMRDDQIRLVWRKDHVRGEALHELGLELMRLKLR